MIKTVFVRNDSHVAESVKEYESAEFISLFARDRDAGRPERSGARTGKIDTGIAEDAPNEAGAVIAPRA